MKKISSSLNIISKIENPVTSEIDEKYIEFFNKFIKPISSSINEYISFSIINYLDNENISDETFSIMVDILVMDK